MINININVVIPMAVVNLPVFFDLVQPAKEIRVINDIIPKKNEITPTSLGSNKSLSITFRGYPVVVFIRSVVIAKTETKKKLAADVDTIMIFFDKRVLTSDTKRFAITAIENPPSNELIIII